MGKTPVIESENEEKRLVVDFTVRYGEVKEYKIQSFYNKRPPRRQNDSQK